MTVSIPPAELAPVVSGLAFPECPRWHESHLWFSDIADGKVLRASPDGQVSVIAQELGRPAGLGWLPGGEMLVAEGDRRRLARLDRGEWRTHADLSTTIPFPCNDMVVDAKGRAYVGNWGFDYVARAPAAPTVLVCVLPSGDSFVAAEEMLFPNGSAVTPDGRTLLVAETYAGRVSAFDVAPEGRLSNRRTWARFEHVRPDGICLDEGGALWIASPPTRQIVRALPGGEITHSISIDNDPLACMLGGEDRRTLFIASSALFRERTGSWPFHTREQLREVRAGRIDSIRVECPGAGLP